jgi:hypothetical protein
MKLTFEFRKQSVESVAMETQVAGSGPEIMPSGFTQCVTDNVVVVVHTSERPKGGSDTTFQGSFIP